MYLFIFVLKNGKKKINFSLDVLFCNISDCYNEILVFFLSNDLIVFCLNKYN